MRIAFVAPLCAPTCDTTSRGAHVILADLARAMKSRGHEVMVFCAEGSYLNGIDTAPVMRQATDAYDMVRWHVDQWDPDVVSQHSSDAEAFGCGGHPVVHTLHANPVDDAATSAAGASGEQLVATSRDSQRRWRASGAHDAHFIANGVPDFGVNVTAAPDPIALIAGRIAPERGTAAAIRVAKRAGLEPVVVGEVCDRTYFAREIVPLLDGVRVLRTIPRARLWTLMARAAVTLMPIEWEEPFGLVAAEAQAAGCPVVGYARGALPEVVPQGEGGVLVSAGDEEALVSAIPIARCMDRVAVREQARDRFDFDAMTDAYEELLAEAATGMTQHQPAAA